MFNDFERVQYEKAPLLEVICQLRFPKILSISAKEPVDFQELIRSKYPRYARNLEKIPPKVMNGPAGVKVEEQPNVVNYQFLSSDGRWKVNLTDSFISLATPAYTTWEEFAGKLDEVLAHFIAVYKPAYFERIGLRYINAVSRKSLNLESYPFRELIQPSFLGLMSEEELEEQNFHRSTQDVELKMPGGCQMRLHCGPGMVKKGSVEDKEVKFIMDIDMYMASKVEMRYSAGALNTLHSLAYGVFRSALTKTLHDALEPM